MRTLRRPIVRELAGFDGRGIIVGTASYDLLGNTKPGWKVGIVGRDEFYVDNQSAAADALLDAGAVKIRTSDGMRR